MKQVNGLLSNIIKSDMTVSEVNRLIYASAYVVVEALGMMRENKANGKKKKEKGKPYWQRRVEKNIVKWRGDLSRVEEMRKGVTLKEGLMKELNKKYDVVEKGCLVVSTLLKNKITSASVKIKNFKDKDNAAQTKYSF